MFQGRIITRSNTNGKVHTFQKAFDDYDDYQKFAGEPSRIGFFPPVLELLESMEPLGQLTLEWQMIDSHPLSL